MSRLTKAKIEHAVSAAKQLYIPSVPVATLNAQLGLPTDQNNS